MKNLLTLLITVIFINQSLAQLWVKSGNDYIADTTYYNNLMNVSIDSMATRVAITIKELNLQTGQEEYITQVYNRTNGVLTELGNPIIGDPLEDSEVTSTSLNTEGNTLIIGRNSFDFQGVNLSGVIEVYELINNNWTLKGDSIGGYGVAAYFGTSVAISNDGNTIIAGGEEGNLFTRGGHVRVFDWNGNNWIQKGDSIRMPINYTRFGASVNINNDGNIIAVGAKDENDTINFINDAGSVILYNWNGSTWEQMGNKFFGVESNESLGRDHGFSLSNDGKTIVIGYSRSNNAKGQVKIFDWDSNNSNWVQKGNTISGIYSRLGDGVNISGNGKSISITGDYGIQMFTYNQNNNLWVKIGQKINEPTADVGYGYLNFDGSILTTPGKIQVPNYSFIYTSLVRFYEFDENAVDINTNLPKEEVSIYPNPTNGMVQIQLYSNENHRIRVSDITGKSIKNFETNNLNNTLDFSLYPKGIYIVTIIKDSKLITTNKIILQ